MINQNIFKDLLEALKEQSKKPQPYDSTAEVRRVEGNTAWVRIPGSEDETPVKLTINAQPGDSVQVRVSGGKAFLVGNATAPPTDDTTAVRAEKKATIIEKTVTKVKEIAEGAARIAGNTRQYFWFTSEGTDTGAHITEKPQEEFLADPANGGGNLLARSNGIAIRDGLTELATFGAGAITMRDSEGIEIFDIDQGAAKQLVRIIEDADNVENYSTANAPETGTTINVKIRAIGPADPLRPWRPTWVILNTSFTAGTSETKTITYSEGTFDAYYDGTTEFSVDFNHSAYVYEVTYFYAAYTNAFTIGRRVGDAGANSYVFGIDCEASGANTLAEGVGTIAGTQYQHAAGKYNSNDSDNAFEIGNGTDDTHRSNAFAVGWDGSVKAAGTITDGNGYTLGWTLADEVTGGTDTITIPSSAKEAYIVVEAGSGCFTKYFFVGGPNISRLEIGGYYSTSSDYGLVNLNVTDSNRTFQIRSAKYGGSDRKSTATMTVYYK